MKVCQRTINNLVRILPGRSVIVNLLGSEQGAASVTQAYLKNPLERSLLATKNIRCNGSGKNRIFIDPRKIENIYPRCDESFFLKQDVEYADRIQNSE